MEGGMENIFKGFDMEAAKQVFQEIDKNLADSDSERLMTFSAFANKMVDEGHYGHRDIVFLEKMVEQIEVFGDYFSNTAEGTDILFIDIDTLGAYSDWLQKLIWHLDGLQITLKGNNLVRAISDIQMRISYFMANIVLHIGSIGKFSRVGMLEQTILNYFSVTEQISVFQEGTLKDLRVILWQTKNEID